MNGSSFPPLVRVALAALLLCSHLHAQSSRPGSGARSNASTTRSSTSSTGVARGNSGGSSRTGSSGGQRQYRSNTELGDAVISIDPETRSLVIVTDEDTHREMATVIKTLDKPKPQVLIKVVFLQVTYKKGYDVGLEGNYTFNLKNGSAATRGLGAQTTTTVNTSGTPATDTTSATTSTTTTSSSLNAVADTAIGLGRTAALSSLFGAPAIGSFVKIASDDWSATLHLLATRGKVEILSRPSIMARNNQEAVIVVGQEVPFITNSRTDTFGQVVNTIQYDNVGIILRVTPFITSENTVEMIVAPEISALNKVDTVPISSTVNAPTIDKRSAETVVVTPHGQTVVIGGLLETQKSDDIRKIPILGDIPLIGAVFRRTIHDDQKRELLIFLTPYIVNDRHTLAQVTDSEMSKTDLAEKAFSKKEFEQFFDELPLPSGGAKTAVPVTKTIPKATAVKARAVKN